MTHERRVLEWTWDEMNGWHNLDDDPANPYEEQLIHEIERLRALVWQVHEPVVAFVMPWHASAEQPGHYRVNCSACARWSVTTRTEDSAYAAHAEHVRRLLDGTTP